MSEKTPVFRVKKWLDKEDYEELLKISDYIGRRYGYSVFRINVNKILRNNLTLQDVKALLENVNAEIDKRDLMYLEAVLKRQRSVELFWDGVNVVMKPNFYLGSIYDSIRGMVEYDPKRKLFKVKPMYYFDLIRELEKLGVYVVNRTNLKDTYPLSFNIELKVTLRPYQEEAVNAWLKNRKGIIALPTGAGKTVIALAIIAKLREKTLIVTYTKDQMMQWREMLLKYTTITLDKIGLYYGDVKKLAPITITTYQTAYKHINRLSPFFSLLVIDEVHHLPAEKFRYIAFNSFALHRLGLSATVIREDGKHEELFPLMGGIVYWKTANELVEEGYLAPFRIKPVYVELTIDEKKKLRELIKLYKLFAKGRSFNDLLKHARFGDEDAQRALSIHSRIRQLIHNAQNKLKAIRDIVEKELEKGSKIIIFTQYIGQAERIAKEIQGLLLTGKMDAKERNEVINKFRSIRKGVLVVTTVGDEGIDIPDANVGIIAAGTGSRRQFIQRLGRLLRMKNGKEAVLYEIIVKGTSEEIQSKKRKSLSLDGLTEAELSEVDVLH